jgi:hypothetical protein
VLKIRHLDIDKAVSRFVANVDSLRRLPFITDAEMALVYGEEVVESLNDLAVYNAEANLCVKCAQKCCPTVKCELFLPDFSQCPIHPYRPALCRMHFCESFPVGDVSFVREFADIFLSGLVEAKRQGSLKADFFDSPPLARYVPELVKACLPWVEAVKSGQIGEAAGRVLILAEAEKHRS